MHKVTPLDLLAQVAGTLGDNRRFYLTGWCFAYLPSLQKLISHTCTTSTALRHQIMSTIWRKISVSLTPSPNQAIFQVPTRNSFAGTPEEIKLSINKSVKTEIFSPFEITLFDEPSYGF